ncbi:hypothetical protein [Aminobacter sp. AP02]|uniref:hypothetical protein n=1 Tax=Aminobacter sp. AP02 TaxID=2135737 RepID=UPI000D7A00F0|nr:hypothetical protein [Aminobacter sp. AP02]PWK72811.1 hypothetical protein C8K44_105254 [Aminobacter sp. AP02]
MSFSRPVSGCALGLTGVAFMALATPAFAATATAAQSTTKACSQQYQAAKKAKTLNGEKWPQFLSNCSATMNNTAAPATAPAKKTSALAPATPAKPAKKTTTAMAAPAAVPGHQTTQQICSQQYQAAKSAGTLNGQKWPTFLSSCSASIKNDKSDATVIPPDPSLASAKMVPPVTSANGKALSPGEIAFRQRIHECSTEWQGEKATGTLPSGAKWPQFWSQCNSKLKAQG